MMSHKYKGRLLLLIAVLFSSLWTSHVQAQQASSNTKNGARKVDEFGLVSGDDHSAHLDNLAIQLQENPELTACVIAYGPEGEGSGTGNYRLRLTKDYLVTARGIDEGRIKIIYGGRYKELGESFSELWLVPQGAEEPQPIKYKSKIRSFTGKLAEYEGWDGLYDADTEGPPVGNVPLASLADLLKSQPKAHAYIVAYNGKEAAPGAWQRVAQREADDLKSSGVESERINVLFGGYDEETKIQLWALPPDAPPPVKPKRERKPEKAVRIGSFNDYELKYKESERWAFNGLADLLKSDEKLIACLVIRPPLAEAQDANPETPVDPDEPQEIDSVQLAEKWKAELKQKYGIGEQRMIIMVVPPKDAVQAGQLETWIVPAGAALPDPSAEDAEQSEENPEE